MIKLEEKKEEKKSINASPEEQKNSIMNQFKKNLTKDIKTKNQKLHDKMEK